MAYPNDLSRTKNWGNEVLTDADLEAQLDLIINWLMAAVDATSGHKHDATANEGPKIATGGLDLSTITQALVMTSKILNQAKGADVASAAGNIALGDDGNYFDITGVAAITSITIKQAGTVVTLQFDSTASLVDGGNLKLNGDFQGAAESQITLISDGTNWFEVSRQPSVVATGYILLKDEKASSTNGGGFTQDAWRTRVINTEETDTGNNCSIAANQITLDVGTYECFIRCPYYAVANSKARLQNITDGTTELEGSSGYSANNFGNQSFIVGRFTIAAEKIFEIQHYCSTTHASNGFGNPGNIAGVNEVYTVAEFRKVA